ncbi:uncharacterized protein [Macrobrachium rosenbergii]|uniref:uncharacterized protein n=1 Tax=Macrobrachium rosenbergii TaxID=79674 RepID=UPI0034D63B6F
MEYKNSKNLIPTVDLGDLGLAHEGEPSEREWTRVAKEITDAFEKVGFVYLSRHGIPDGRIKKLFEASAAFFNLPQQDKDKYSWDLETYCGYVPVNREKLNPTSVSEVKETYNIKRADEPFPDEAVPEFRGAMRDFVDSCERLASRILISMALGLDIHRNFFVDAHSRVFREGNSTALRMINYPPIIEEKLPNSTRCGPHTDYGTLTLLFQDDIGGLQVRDQSTGNWVDAGAIPGTVLVNIGDLMQFWTSGKFTATEHRVIIPVEEDLRRQSRRSIAFFLNPDDDKVISPLDGSSKFDPVTCEEYIRMRISQSYAGPSNGLE